MPRLLTVDEIQGHRQKYIEHIPRDLPSEEKGRVHRAIEKSLDALQADDGDTAYSAVEELLDVMRQHPDAGKGEPAPGHNLWAQYWLGCGNDCGGGGVATGSVWGPAVYATCYWSCVAANAL